MKLSPVTSLPHPMQPVGLDEENRARFKQNDIVRFLYDFSRGKGMGLDELAGMPWGQDTWDHFHQLIGYSVDGYSELSLVSAEAKELADKLAGY